MDLVCFFEISHKFLLSIAYKTINNGLVIFLFVLLILYLFYYFVFAVQKPILICSNRNFKQFLIENCYDSIEKPFYPTIWGFEKIVQMVLGESLRGKVGNLKYRREIIVLPDKGEVSLDWYEDEIEINYEERPICVLIPGILGGSQESYIKTLTLKGNSIGMHCCALNNRGKGEGTILKTPKLFSSADSHKDLEFVLNHLRIKNPYRRIYSIGLSFGGINLGRYLASTGEKAVVDGCMLVSTIFDFFSACTSIENINDRMNMIINRKLCRLYKQLLIKHRDVLELNKNIDIDHVLESETLFHLKSRFTIKMFGYSTIEEYLAAASIRDMIPEIKKPCLFLHAKDDAFQPIDCLVIKQFERSKHCSLIITNKGSHLGFVDNNHVPFLKSGEFYLERLCGQFFSGLNKLENLEYLEEECFS